MNALIALGSNAPQAGETAQDTVMRAFRAIADAGLRVARTSALYQTPCFPAGAGPDYVNAAAAIDADGSPHDVMACLHRIEAAFGRKRVQRWGMRVLDLDLLAWGDMIEPDLATYQTWRDLPTEAQMTIAPDRLILPHPRLHERAFVLVPLAEIAPDWCHPVLRQSIADLTQALPAADRAQVTRL